MTQIRIDRVIFSSYHEAYQNYDNPAPQNIVVATTSLANGATRNISVTIPYTRANTRADVYATRGDVKTLVSVGGRAAASSIYQFVSNEIATFDVRYTSTDITVILSITNNTGSSINPIAQTIAISVVQYQAPIAPI